MENERKEKYLDQLEEAIKQLNAMYAEYENFEFLVTDVNKLTSEEKQYLQELINKIRIYETHSYIRAAAIEKDFDNNHPLIIELRKKIKTRVPLKKDLEELVKGYNLLQCRDLSSEKFVQRL